MKLTKDHVDTSNFYWLTHVVDQKSLRLHIRSVLIKDGFAYATDGARLCWIELKGEIDYADYQNGVYEVLKRTKTQIYLDLVETDISVWPEVKDLLPTNTKGFVEFNLSSRLVDFGLKPIFQALKNGNTYNIQFFIETLKIKDSFIGYMPQDQNQPFWLTDEDTTMQQIIMPARDSL